MLVDWYAPKSSWGRRLLSTFLGNRRDSALGARAEGIPDHLVTSNPITGLVGKWKQTARRKNCALHDIALRVDTAFTRAAARRKAPPHDAIFGYSYMSLELFEKARRKGVFTVLDQIDPGPLEFRLVADEMRDHPELAGLPEEFPLAYYERLKREWNLADLILVNSEWTRDAIVSEGADPAKIEIIPLAYEPLTGLSSAKSQPPSTAADGLKVLWLGQVNVRKGIHYLLEAAKLLQAESVRFLIAGPRQIRSEVVAGASPCVKWLGPVPRPETPKVYASCDIFVLPTLSDGFAITQIEALAHGLPLIVTPNCAKIVKEGKTGYQVPARDAGALAGAVRRFLKDPQLARTMSSSCRHSASVYSVDAYGARLIEILEARLRSPRLASPA